MTKTTIVPTEVSKFASQATEWWSVDGPLKTLHHINPIRLQFINNTVSLVGSRVLDVGCGGGILSEAMAMAGAMVTGLDVALPSIEVAKAHAEQRQLPITYVCEPLEQYHAPLFDCISCMELLEHVSDPWLLIEHCARLLRPGGYLFLSTINRTVKAYASVIIAAEYVLGILPRQTHEFAKFIKPSELATMAHATGMSLSDMAGLGYNPLTRQACLQAKVDVNYLMAFQKENKS